MTLGLEMFDMLVENKNLYVIINYFKFVISLKNLFVTNKFIYK